jgi:pentatricopeptide repeat domain-containing protein 1
MKAQGCRGDAIVYNAIIDTLWETGVVWAQRRGLQLFRVAVEEGHFQQATLAPGLVRAEVNLHAMTAGVAMLCLYAWLVSLRQLEAKHGGAALPARLAVVTDKGKGSKEQGNLVVKEAVAAMMQQWDAPFR